MKIFLRYVLIMIGVIILMELNSNSLISDIKGFFQKSPYPSSSMSYTSSDTDTIPGDYLQILHLKKNCCNYTSTSQLFLQHMAMNPLIGPVSSFVYKRNYYLHVCKLSNSFTLSLNNVIYLSNISPKQLYGFRESDEQSAVDYLHKLIPPPQNITTIYLKLLGKNNHIIFKNDSVACYYSMFTKFSIQYNNQDDPTEILAETKGSNPFYTNLLPMEILFLKKDNKLYLLAMSVFNDVQDLKYSPGMLYNLIKPDHANNN